MFKKHFQDVIQALLKEFKKRQTKQRNLKDVNIGIRHRTSLIKPETLAISGSNEKQDSSADGLRLTRLFDAVFKKFVNPKLDLMATLEQIKAMESKRRVDVLMSLRGFLNFENRSRVPALPATSSPSRDDKSLPPDKLSIGWTGQPTIKRITCNVETSSHPRGFDYAFLNFPEFKEDFEKSHPPPMEPPVVRLKKTRSKSNTKCHRRRKISPETAPTPEFPTVDVYGNSSEIVQNAVLNSSDGQNLKEHVLETETFQLKRAASEDSTNNNKSLINVSLQGLSLDNNFSLNQLNSPESLQGREYLNYKSVQEVKLVGQKSKDEIAQDTRSNDIVSSQQTKQLDSEPDITQSADENMDFAKEHVNTSSSDKITDHQSMARACNKELEGVDVDDKGKDHCTEYDSSGQTRNFEENDYGNHRIGIDSYKRGSSVDKENEFNIPKKLIEYAPSTASLKGRGYAKPEQGRAPLRKERALEIGEFPANHWFVNTETNEFTLGRESKFGLKEKTKVRHSKLKNKTVPTSVNLNSIKDVNSNKEVRASLRKERPLEIGEFPEKYWFVNSETNEFTLGREAKFGNKDKTKVRHSKLTNKTVQTSVNLHSIKDINSKKDILNENTILEGKKKNIARNTKSEINLRPERKAIEAERQFSKSSLRKLNTNKISSQANYFKNTRYEAWLQGRYKKIGEQNESKGLQSKMKLSKLPENVRDIISKSVTFKAGNYKLRSKHFLREKFSSAVSLKRTNRKNSASKYSLDLHVDNSFEIAKKKINKPRTFLSKHASQENVAITSLSPQRPRKALMVKGIKRTKVISNSNPALPNSNKNYTYFKEPSKPSADKGRKKLPDYAKKVKSNKSKTKLLNKGSSNMLAQNKSGMKLINPKYLSNPKLTYVDKNKHVSQSKYNLGKRVKNFTLDESKVGKNANSAGSTLNASKVRRHHSMRLKPKPILLKMYGRDRGTFFDNPASNIHTLDSAGIKNLGQQLKRSSKNRLSSQTSYIKDDSVINTNSNRVKHRSVPIINVHVRSFSTIRNYKQCNKTVSTIKSKSTPFINNGGPFKDQKNKHSSATNLRTKLSDGTTANPIVEKKRNKKKELELQKSWITIKNGVYAKQADQILTSVSAPPKGGNKLKRKYRKKSLKRKLKGRKIFEFEKDKQVRTTSVTDKSPGNNELNVKVLYKRQCYNSKMKLKGNDSETNVHIGNMSGNKLELERPNLVARVNHGNAIPSKMNQSVVDKCVNRTKLSSLKVLLPPSAENVDSKKPRRWKSKADRLNKLRFYKKENQRVLNVNQQLAKMSYIRNNSVQSNEQLAKCAPFKSVNLVDKLNHDVERLAININKYKFPRRSQKYYLKSHLSTSHTEPVLDNLGGYKNNNIYEESQASRISSVSNTINDCNAKIAKAGVKCNCEQNQTSINARGKINLPLLDELSKSQLSKSVPGSTGNNSVNKNKQSGNHAGLKGFTEGLTKLSVGATKASRKHKSTLDYRMDTMVSKLLPQAIKADAPKTKSVDRSNKVKTQPGKLKPILQEMKPLEGIMVRYKPECSITNEPLHVARSVNNNFNSSNISRGKILSEHVEPVKNINTKVASKEDSQINHLVESKTKTHSAQNISVDKLRKVIIDNQNKKEVINIESFRVSNTKKNIDKTKNKLSKGIVSTTPTLDKLILNASKPDNNHIHNIKLNVAGKINTLNTLNSDNEIIEMKNNAHLNSSKTFEKDFGFVNDQNRNTLHKGILRAMQIKHGAPAYGKSFPKEERRPPNVKKLNFNKISNKIKNDISKLTKETLKCSGNPVMFTSKPTLSNTKVKKDQPQILLNDKKFNKVNKITEKSLTLSSSVNRHLQKKISFSKASTLTIDKSVNISDSDKTTTTLKLDINKPLERNRSSSKASYKNEFTKTAVKHRSNLLAPNIKKPILLHQTNDSEPPHTKESVKFSEKRLISLTNKKEIATEIISTPMKPLNISNTMAKTSNRDVIKSSTFTQPPVCDSKPSKTIPRVPSFMDTHKLKSLEQQKQEKILTQQPIEQVNSFHGLSFKEEPTKKQANLITNLKQSQISDKITKAVTQIQQKISTHAVSHKNESKKQNRSTDIEKQAGKGTAKVTEENSTSYDISGCTMRGRGINRGLEPGFI